MTSVVVSAAGWPANRRLRFFLMGCGRKATADPSSLALLWMTGSGEGSFVSCAPLDDRLRRRILRRLHPADKEPSAGAPALLWMTSVVVSAAGWPANRRLRFFLMGCGRKATADPSSLALLWMTGSGEGSFVACAPLDDRLRRRILRRLHPADKGPIRGGPCAPLDDKRRCECGWVAG